MDSDTSTPSHKNSRQTAIALGIVVVAGLIYAGMSLNPAKNNTPEAAKTSTDEKQTTTQTYSSAEKGIAFEYPANYTVQETTVGNEQQLRISNYTGVTKADVPSDFLAMSIAYGELNPTAQEREAALIKDLPSIKKQAITTTDGNKITYYVYYSDQASDYSTSNSDDRLAQILAVFTLDNGKTFTAQIDNYEFTPQAQEDAQIDFIIALLKTITSP